MIDDNYEFQIIDPVKGNFDLFIGESKNLSYSLKNDSDYAIKDIEFTAVTIRSDGEKTKSNYAEVGEVPKIILAHTLGKVNVVVTVPKVYEEFIMKDNRKILIPFSVHVVAKGIKYVQEV